MKIRGRRTIEHVVKYVGQTHNHSAEAILIHGATVWPFSLGCEMTLCTHYVLGRGERGYITPHYKGVWAGPGATPRVTTARDRVMDHTRGGPAWSVGMTQLRHRPTLSCVQV